MNDKKMKKAIGGIFDSILSTSQAEALQNFPELHKYFEGVLDKDIDTFNYEVIHSIDSALRNVIATALNRPAYDKSVSALVFLYMNYHFVEGHLRYFIEVKEGMACCADKSSWLIRAIKKHYIDGSEIDMTIGEKCYWKPHFWTGAEWLELFECIHGLYFKFSNEYMLFLQKNWVPMLQKPKA